MVAPKIDTFIPKVAAPLTPAQLTKLKTGKKINITVGREGDSFIAIEGAHANLLNHHWGVAKTKLANGASALFIEDGVKSTVQWIYTHMLAGEKDPEFFPQFDTLTLTQLIELYDYAVYLQYESLENRVFGRVRYLIRNTFSNIEELQQLFTVIPKMAGYVSKLVVELFTEPLIFDYSPYMEYASRDEDFGAALDMRVREKLDHLIQRSVTYYNGPHFARYNNWVKKNFPPHNGDTKFISMWAGVNGHQSGGAVTKSLVTAISNRHSAATVPPTDAKSQVTPTCYRCQKAGHVARYCKKVLNETATPQPADNTSTQKPREPPTCFNCKKRGHLSRDCTAPMVDPPTCYNCKEVGHISRHCTTSVSQPPKTDVQDTRTCYNCNETGHISRSCPRPPKVPNSIAKDANARRIELAADGEGVKTCTREAKPGEYTRTGLKI